MLRLCPFLPRSNMPKNEFAVVYSQQAIEPEGACSVTNLAVKAQQAGLLSGGMGHSHHRHRLPTAAASLKHPAFVILFFPMSCPFFRRSSTTPPSRAPPCPAAPTSASRRASATTSASPTASTPPAPRARPSTRSAPAASSPSAVFWLVTLCEDDLSPSEQADDCWALRC